MTTPDKGIPQEVLEHAKCVAVVPHMIKGGLVFGAENGKGHCHLPDRRWLERTGVLCHHRRQLGIQQIGVEGVDPVMVFQGDKGMLRLEDA